MLLLTVLWWMRLRGLCKLPDRKNCVGRAMFSKALIQLSADGWVCTPSLAVVWPEETQPEVCGLYDRVIDDLMPRGTFQDCCYQCPCPQGEPLLTHTSTGDPPTLAGRSGSVSCGVTASFPWVLVCTNFVCVLQDSSHVEKRIYCK